MVDQVRRGNSRPAAAEMLSRLEIAAAAALNMEPNASKEGRDALQVIEAPKGILQPVELLRQPFGVDVRGQDLEQGLAGIAQSLGGNTRAMPIVERSVASLGPFFQELRMKRPDARDCKVLRCALDQ